MKKLLLILAFFIGAQHAFAYEIIAGHSPVGSDISTTLEQYVPFNATTLLNSNAARYGIIPFNGTLGNIAVRVTSVPGGSANWVFTVMQNNATTSATCTVTSAVNTCTITGIPLSVLANDGLQMSSQPVGGPAIMRYGFSAQLYPQNPGDIAIMQNNGASSLSTSLEQFSTVSGGLPFAPSAIEASSTQLVPVAGTFSNLYSQLNLSPGGVGKSYTSSLRLNFASTSLSASISNTATAANDLTDTQTVSQLDLVDLATVPAGTPTARSQSGAMRFRAADGITSSVFISSISSVTDSVVSSVYLTLSGPGTGGGNSTVTQTPMAAPLHFTTLCASTTAPGGVATRKFILVVNGALTSLSVTLTGAQTNACITGDIKTEAGDTVAIQDLPSGSPAVGNPMVSLAASDPHGVLRIVSGILRIIGGVLRIQ